MHNVFEIELILVTIFHYLSDKDLFSCRSTNSDFLNLVDLSHPDLKEFTWKKIDKLLQQMKSDEMMGIKKYSSISLRSSLGLNYKFVYTNESTYIKITSVLTQFSIIKKIWLHTYYSLGYLITITKKVTFDNLDHQLLLCVCQTGCCIVDVTNIENIQYYSFNNDSHVNDTISTLGSYFYNNILCLNCPYFLNYRQFKQMNLFNHVEYENIVIEDWRKIVTIQSLNSSFVSFGYHQSESDLIVVYVYEGSLLKLSNSIRNQYFDHGSRNHLRLFFIDSSHLLFFCFNQFYIYDLSNQYDCFVHQMKLYVYRLESILQLDQSHIAITYYDDQVDSKFSLLVFNLQNHSHKIIQPDFYFTMSKIHQINDSSFDIYSTIKNTKPFRLNLNDVF